MSAELGGGQGIRLVYAADLHGEDALYASLHALVQRSRPSALLLGGDQFAHTNEPAEQVAFVTDTLRPFIAALGVPVFGVWGNVDWPPATAAAQCARDAGSMDVAGTATAPRPAVSPLTLAPVVVADGLCVVGYPHVPPTPFRQKWGERRDLAADTARVSPMAYVAEPDGEVRFLDPRHLDGLPSIEDDLQSLDPADAEAVWVFHTPPYGAGIDATHGGAAAGCRALRAAIERLQPPLTLHGHIHEAPEVSGRWVERIGRTVCVNPGRGTAGQGLRAVVADLAPDGTVEALDHTQFGGWAPD